MDGLKIEQLQSLQSKDQAALLDTVDEIRRHGVNRYVSLPQLIVCGDQSSGKSSVLEAISGVQFPVNDGLCTRFTTEVVLRRATKSLATVKLIPAKDAPPFHIEKLLLFKKSSISHAKIPDLISEAKTFMDLTGSSTFSRDILQLEVSGPKLPHLTLVDLPGLIHHPNKEQTEEDVHIPKELVQKYMSQSRSIVLAIITAKNDTSNQVVLEMAKAADPQGNRTMGIITKPDCLIKDSPNELNFFALASNKETYFKLDWHVLRNGDFNERKDSTFDRDAVEKAFFASTLWKNLPSHKRGVEALRTRLSHVLYQQIQKELPSLIKEIEAELAACKTTMDRLGLPRDTAGSRRQYLTGIAGRFLELVRAANDGAYQDPFFRSTNSGVLGTVQLQKTRLRATFLQEIRQLLNDSKGRELPGTFTPLLVGDLFIRQSTNWKPFALDFVEDVWNIAKQFLDDVLVHVADEDVREALLEEIIDPEMDRILMKLKDKVTELHSPYARGSLKTLNPRFVKELENRRSQQAQNPSTQPGTILGMTGTEDADSYACRELLHLMQAYYTVALDVFVDNVSSLAVENCLMIALEDLLSPLTVSEMSDEKLEDIASESPDVHELRSQTLEKQSSLQKSFELCRRQARKLASNRLNEEAQKKTQKTETLLTSVTEGSARVNITPAASVATPIKSQGYNNTTSQPMTQGPAAFRASNAFSTKVQSAPRAFSPSLFTTTGSSVGHMTPQTSSVSLSPIPLFGGGQNAPQTATASLFGAPSAGTGQDAPKISNSSLFGNAPSAGTRQDAPKTSASLFNLASSQKGLSASPVGTTNQGSNGTLPSGSKTSGGGLVGRSTPTPSLFGPKTTGGGFGSTDGLDSTEGFGSKGLFGRSTSPLGARSGIGGFASTGATTSPRASIPFQNTPAQPNQTDSSSDADKGNAK
ncbi:hypothetical protein UA08_06379 [Talaromyces atroroseus]|uniref:GED domain-containing protein n=1 Tax=Talaromyces atroroseus TaxID=1441469 RepID=A0A225AMC2_TALAT|nr:hypothetical protein UA08_06379 [Talaromyces atroroseus]OKL58398.1 hypothetical protein UA08_06379 [Talaromyces atroroseus]